MSKAHLYKIKNIRTGEYFPGVYRKSEVAQLIGIKHDLTGYAKHGHAINGMWKIEYADEEKPTEDKSSGLEAEWAREWDKARLKLLKAYGKA
jgi:hypothetical protein